jgi:phosphopantothenoylcysteine synthetase/decarboxylase
MRFLVTAGSTREMLDRVRDWGNIFTGETGYAIAAALSHVGEVDLLTSNRTHADSLAAAPQAAHPIHAVGFRSHADLKDALAAHMAAHRYDAVFMTSAVSDYRPVRVYAVIQSEPDSLNPSRERWVVQDVQADKVKSTHPAIAVLGEPTEKLVDLFRTQWRHRGLLVKFKLEVGLTRAQLIEIGQASRRASGAEYLVANTLEMVTGPDPGAYLLSDAGAEWVLRADLPTRLSQLVRDHPVSPASASAEQLP